MKNYLFEDFLNEKLIYNECKTYWEIRLNELFTKHKLQNIAPYLNTIFGDGSDFFNGNPMVNYNSSDLNRAIRIIQEEPNSEDLEITAWIDRFETDDFQTLELVISMQLTPNSERIAFELIRKWLVDIYSKEKMERFIELKIELEDLELANQL